jgi:hypothetical protein
MFEVPGIAVFTMGRQQVCVDKNDEPGSGGVKGRLAKSSSTTSPLQFAPSQPVGCEDQYIFTVIDLAPRQSRALAHLHACIVRPELSGLLPSGENRGL